MSGSYALECGTKYPRSGKITFKYLDDYDTGCNGYSLDTRIHEQKRILSSVRRELLDSSKKLEKVNQIIDDLNRQIPIKQQELQFLHEAKESAERALEDLKDRRNVRVFLPHSPLNSPKHNSEVIIKSDISSLEDIIDFSRCSITAFFPIFIDDRGNNPSWMNEFKKLGNIISNKDLACLTIILADNSTALKDYGSNSIIINFGEPISPLKGAIMIQRSKIRRNIDESIFLNVPRYSTERWKVLPQILPYFRKFLFSWIIFSEELFDATQLDSDIMKLHSSAKNSSDTISIIRCKHKGFASVCTNTNQMDDLHASSIFCLLLAADDFQENFWKSLAAGCIPIVLSYDIPLPFETLIDWRLAIHRIPLSRLPELHFIIRSFEMADVLEMRRNGRTFFEKYLMDKKAIVNTVVSSLSHRIGVPLKPTSKYEALPLFNQSFVAPILVPVNLQPFDDEYLGPLEAPHESPRYLHNFTSLQMYSGQIWNQFAGAGIGQEFLPFAADPPTESEFYSDSNAGFRSIEPGSGDEFSKALGGNRPREQFTIVMLTYNRDAILASALERLHRLPYLQKVIVIWHNLDRNPIGAWPRLHVPVEFLKVDKNSLNNRFIPWDRIETEAVLSLDDDIDLKHYEIIFAFRVWRENRDRIVGFPARYHARFGDSMFYNSNHTCQLSMILTGASFIHKSFLHAYTNGMSEVIRQHVDEVMNCEDIAMNFLVSHLTRKPPIKTTSKWTLRCQQCTEALSQGNDHFDKRHECIRFFSKVYGYNPLKFSQFRADSVLFKTRLPADKQKCFKYV